MITVSHANERPSPRSMRKKVRDRPRAAHEKRDQPARKRHNGDVRRRRLEDLTRERTAARGLRVRAEQRVTRHEEREYRKRPQGIDGDERDVLAERCPQTPSDERVSDDDGGQDEGKRIELRASEHRYADRQRREQVARDRWP